MHATLAFVVVLALGVPNLGEGAGEAAALTVQEPGDAFPPESYSTYRRPPPRKEVTRVQTDCRLLHMYEINDVQVRGAAAKCMGFLALMLISRSPRRPCYRRMLPSVDRPRGSVHSLEVRAAEWGLLGGWERHPSRRNAADSVTRVLRRAARLQLD